jgi:F0F1-type ATP synthase membrane subunit a
VRKERAFETLLASPLEQFDLLRLFPFYFRSLDLSLFTLTIPLALLSLALFLGVAFFSRNVTLIPSSWQHSMEMLYSFI